MPGRTTHAQSRREPSSHTFASHQSANMEYGAMAFVSSVAWFIYWSTLEADFAYDDSRAIKTNQDLLPTTSIPTIFKNDFWGTPLTHSGSHKSYRPLCVLSFRFNHFLGGMDPWGYHLVNVLLHASTSAIFTHLAALLFLHHTLPTLVAGLLFAVHPIHTEAVAGVVGRADVGACFFFLLSLLFYMKYCKYRDKDVEGNSRWFHLYSSLIWGACSMLTKEHGITVLAVCGMYDVIIHHKVAFKDLLAIVFEKRFQGLREGLLHLAATTVSLLALRLHLMGIKPPDFAPADNPAADSDSVITRTLTFLYLPAFNFWMLLCPRWLSFDWSMEAVPLVNSPCDLRNIVTLCFYSGLIVLVYRNFVRRGSGSESAFTQNGNLCPFLGLGQGHKIALTTCGTNSIQQRPHRKHQAYLLNNNYSHPPYASYLNGHRVTNGHCHPPANSALCVPPSITDVAEVVIPHSSTPLYNHTDTVVVALTLLILPFVPATNLFFYVGFVVAERVLYIPSMGFCLLVALGVEQVYRRQDRAFRKRALICIVLVLLMILSIRTIRRNSDWLTEETLYRSGIPINPPKAYGNLANILSSQGKKAEAEWAYRKALSYRSNMADVRYNLGILLQEQGRFEEALNSYRLAIQFRPRLAMAHLNMGLVLGILGRKEEAAEVYRHCAQLDSYGLKDPKMHESTKISALFNLGRLYADEGKYQEAIDVYFEAVQKMPEHYQPQSLFNMMGEAFFKLGQYEEAEHWYQESLRVKPDHIPAHLTYAKLLSKWNRPSAAEHWFLKAKSIAPNDSSVYQHYGQFLSELDRHEEAAEVFVIAADLAPDEYEIIFNAANTLRQAARNLEAEKYYQMAVKLRPNEVTSHMNLGAMLHVNGKLMEAESSYLEALRLKPDDPITQNNLQKLRNLLVQKGLRPASTQSRR